MVQVFYKENRSAMGIVRSKPISGLGDANKVKYYCIINPIYTSI